MQTSEVRELKVAFALVLGIVLGGCGSQPVTLVEGPPDEAIAADQASSQVGEVAVVCGRVASAEYASTSSGSPTFLNLDEPYPNHAFTVVIWEEDRASFVEAPEVAFNGQDVCVEGLVTSFRGIPQIEADSGDIWVVEH